jgi:hypothetical protein
MEDFSEEARREEFIEFFLDGFPSIVCKVGSFRIDIE